MTYIHPATNEQVAGWKAAILAPSPDAQWSDFVVAQLCARVEEDRLRYLTVMDERDSYRFTAEQKVFVRQELEAELGTEGIGEAVRLIRGWKAAASS